VTQARNIYHESKKDGKDAAGRAPTPGALEDAGVIDE